MRRTYLFATVGVLTATLATWAAIRGAQPDHNARPAELPPVQAAGQQPIIPPPPPGASDGGPPAMPGRLPENLPPAPVEKMDAPHPPAAPAVAPPPAMEPDAKLPAAPSAPSA